LAFEFAFVFPAPVFSLVFGLRFAFTLVFAFRFDLPFARAGLAGSGIGPAVGSTVVGAAAGLLVASPAGAGCVARRVPRPRRDRAIALDGVNEHWAPPGTGLNVRRSPLFRPLNDTIFGGAGGVWPATAVGASPNCITTAVYPCVVLATIRPDGPFESVN